MILNMNYEHTTRSRSCWATGKGVAATYPEEEAGYAGSDDVRYKNGRSKVTEDLRAREQASV